MSRLSRGLALFALASSVLGTALLASLGEVSVAQDLRHFATGTQGVDSWRPMKQAHVYLAQGAEKPLYAWLFFEQKVKFIYPPTSLLLLDVVPSGSLREALNALSWLLVAITAVFSVLTLDRALEGSAHAAGGSADRALRLGAGLLLALTFYPVLKAYSLGQMQVWVNALFAVAAWCWLGDRKLAAGVAVALMAAVKPQYGLIGVWALFRGEWRFAGSALVSALLLLAVSSLRFGFEHHADYLKVVSHVSRLGEAYWPNQTVGGFLHRLLGNGVSSHWDPQVYPPYHAVVHGGSLLASAAVLGVAIFGRTSADARGGPLDFAAAALATTLASPIAWEHHYGVLLSIFALMLPATLDAAGRWRPALPLLAAAFVVAAHYWDVLRRIDGTAWNPLQSLLLFAALGLLAGLALLRTRGSSVRHS